MSESYVFQLPAGLLWEFCRVMDSLPDSDWSRFASQVLSDQTDVRLVERRSRRTDWLMNQWGSKNARVKDLLELLERLQLFRARDLLLNWRSEAQAPPAAASRPCPPPCPLTFDHALRTQEQLSLATETLSVSGARAGGGAGALPKPGPPPSSLHSGIQPLQFPEGPECPGGPGVPVDPGGAGVPVDPGSLMSLSYEDLEAGTQGFSAALLVGEGRFGTLHKACIGKTTYAVKRLKEGSELNWSLVTESFRTEVEKLSRYRHPNVMQLCGFSVGSGSYCLIYSFMEKGSLEDGLHGTAASALSWQQRLTVLEGTASALKFLHLPPAPHPPLIHGDVKSSNILLDQNLLPKLGDFGLARFCGRQPGRHTGAQTTYQGVTDSVRGTQAYLPDRCTIDGRLGTRVDIFSFGVVLLEVLTGRKAVETDQRSRTRYLKDLPSELEDSPSIPCVSSVSTGLVSSPVAAELCRAHLDPRLSSPSPGGAGHPVTGCEGVAALACSCLNRNGTKRPPMSKVFDKLNDILSALRTSQSCQYSLPTQYSQPSQSCQYSLPTQSSQSSQSCQYSLCTPSSQSSLPIQSADVSSLSQQLSELGALGSSSLAGPCESDESEGFSQFSSLSQFSTHTGNQFDSGSALVGHQSGSLPQCAGPSGQQSGCPSEPSEPSGGQGSTSRSRPGAASGLQPAGCTDEQMHYGPTSGPEESDELDYLPDH